ncbi:dUTP diphosphatase [candidate division KSB1 bacterium]|nr:dUTP diphosphatase [candidate division KSB1 bacterium]
METIRIPCRRTCLEKADVPLPQYMSSGASGMDIFAAVEEPLVIEPGQTVAVPTGLVLAIPEGYEGQIRPRSGLALHHNIGLLNAPGTIDSDYRGEVKIILTNFGKDDFTIHRGDRIAQLVVQKVVKAELEEVTTIPDSPRGRGGFGHTGTG